jgi:hypothetical protein
MSTRTIVPPIRVFSSGRRGKIEVDRTTLVDAVYPDEGPLPESQSAVVFRRFERKRPFGTESADVKESNHARAQLEERAEFLQLDDPRANHVSDAEFRWRQ